MIIIVRIFELQTSLAGLSLEDMMLLKTLYRTALLVSKGEPLAALTRSVVGLLFIDKQPSLHKRYQLTGY